MGGKRSAPARRYHNNPSRGSPGFLLTCETGREARCRREGLQILEHYWRDICDDDESLGKQSLEEELALLKAAKKNKAKAQFAEFATGCRGTVFFLVANSNKTHSVDEISTQQPETDANDNSSDPAKRQRLDNKDDTPSPSAPTLAAVEGSAESARRVPLWQTLNTAQSIFQDIQKASLDCPSSRFVTRIIPLQTTCFASTQDIKSTVQGLLNALLLESSTSQKCQDGVTTTFAVQFKRRNCDHLKRDQVIQAVASQVVETTQCWKVDLTNPDYTVWIEVCRTLCGVSIVPSKYLAATPKFNIAELRDQSQRGKDG